MLDLADALGVYDGGRRCEYRELTGIWSHDGVGACECALYQNDPEHKQLSVPDFISGMYALAEKKEKDRATELQAAPDRVSEACEIQDRLHALEVKSVLLDDILKRLTDLESWRDKVIGA